MAVNLIENTLQNTFHHEQFRPGQQEAIEAAMLGRDCIVIMAHRAGKSLCFQLPASIGPGVTIVIAPLVALIDDQVARMTDLGIRADHLRGREFDYTRIYEELGTPNFGLKLLYVTPEKIASDPSVFVLFQRIHEAGKIDRFVVDEAHCIRQWGNSFRPQYGRLRRLRDTFLQVPIMALMATFNLDVQQDVITGLNLHEPNFFRQSLYPLNLKLQVRSHTNDDLKDVETFIRTSHAGNCGMIFCHKKDDCERFAVYLRPRGIIAEAYHADIDDQERVAIQNRWSVGETQVICATVAFGMGLDKPDVRFVVHFRLRSTIEQYYDEVGRAGHDGVPADCILYHGSHDEGAWQYLIERTEPELTQPELSRQLNRLSTMVKYASNDRICRRRKLLNCLGEDFNGQCEPNIQTACDICSRSINV